MSKAEIRKAVDDFIGSGGHPTEVIIALYDAMMETAEHIRHDWQDAELARVWEQAAKTVDRIGMGAALQRLP